MTDVFYAKNREIAYKTVDNKLLFERRDDDFPKQRFRTGFKFILRPKFKSYHFYKIEYQD